MLDKTSIIFLLKAALLCVALSVGTPLAHAQWLTGEEAIMGTAVRVELWADDKAAGEAAITAVMAEMHRIDREMSPYKPESELSRINREAADHPVPISAEMFDILSRSIEFSKLSGGAFDITFSSVGYMYDYRHHIKPTDKEIEQALPGINYRHMLLDAQKRTVKFARPGVRIDLGGIGKGYAVDNSIALLKKRGITHAIVTAGGDSRVLGDRRGRPWMVGIRDPRRKDNVVAVLPLINSAISTSGDYERYFEVDGVRYHHILNPKTGRSATGVHSVSVIGPDATTTDGLTKPVFILGPEKGLRLIESIPGVDAVIVDANGKMFYSSGLQNRQPEASGPTDSTSRQ
ncbi:MAG: FAD:protein FMN transferase [Gammaproteobacteria bacterium]|nr:FAD:protein FMN transferase [Gammaproteobacteria bacterium]